MLPITFLNATFHIRSSCIRNHKTADPFAVSHRRLRRRSINRSLLIAWENGVAAEESGDMDQRSADQNTESDLATAVASDGGEVALGRQRPRTAEEDSGRVGAAQEAN